MQSAGVLYSLVFELLPRWTDVRASQIGKQPVELIPMEPEATPKKVTLRSAKILLNCSFQASSKDKQEPKGKQAKKKKAKRGANKENEGDAGNLSDEDDDDEEEMTGSDEEDEDDIGKPNADCCADCCAEVERSPC